MRAPGVDAREQLDERKERKKSKKNVEEEIEHWFVRFSRERERREEKTRGFDSRK